MNCANCKTKLKTSNSRLTHSGQHTWRRKQCPQCKRVITTYERPSLEDILVEKKDKSVEPFDRDKLYRSLILSNTQDSAIAALTDTITKFIVDSTTDNKITSSSISKIALDVLQRYDKVPYLRYGSYHSELL